MKLKLLLLAILFLVSAPLAHAADRYWVGGTGTWDASDTSHWSTSSGGASGASVPTSSDNVIFDTASNATAYTVTISATANTADLTIGNPLAGNLTLAGSSALSVYGSFNIANITRTYTGAITFRATATGKTLTFNGETMASATTFDGVGGGWTVQDAWNNGTSNITLTNGTLNTNGQTITCGTFASSNSNTRTLTLGASTINVSTTWNMSTITSLTFNPNTSTIVHTGQLFIGGGLTYNNVILSRNSQQDLSGSNTFANLTRNGITSSKTAALYIDNASPQVITGLLTLDGNSTTTRLLVSSSRATGTMSAGSPVTLTAASVSLSYVDFQDITASGAASPFTGTSIGDCGGNTNITAVTPTTRYGIAAGNWSSTSIWSTSSGGASGASIPLPQDTVILDSNSGVGTVTADMPRMGGDLTTTNYTGTLAFNSTANSVYGSVVLGSGMTISGTQTTSFSGRGSETITSNSKTLTQGITINTSGSYSIQDNLSVSNIVTLTRGTFDLNSFNAQSTTFVSSGSETRTITLGSGTYTVTSASAGTPWNMSSTGTVTSTTGTIKYTGGGPAALVFAGGGKTYGTLWFDRGVGAGSITISGSNTFTEFKDTGTAAHSLLFTAGTTQTIGTWTVSGSSGNVITIDSTTTTNFNLVKTGGGQTSSDWLAIANSTVTPTSTWCAGANSTDGGGGNSGWYFQACPIVAASTFKFWQFFGW